MSWPGEVPTQPGRKLTFGLPGRRGWGGGWSLTLAIGARPEQRADPLERELGVRASLSEVELDRFLAFCVNP